MRAPSQAKLGTVAWILTIGALMSLTSMTVIVSTTCDIAFGYNSRGWTYHGHLDFSRREADALP